MRPHESHTEHTPVGDGEDHQHDALAKSPPSSDSAGVTVPTEPLPPGGADQPNTKPKRRGNAHRTGRNLVVRGIRRDPPETRKLAHVIASLATEMLEDATDTDTEATGAGADQKTPRRAA